MITYVAYGLIALACLAALHFLALWMERRGWIYYWHKRSTSGAASAALGAAMQEVNALANPEVRHVVEERQSEHKREAQADGLGDED